MALVGLWFAYSGIAELIVSGMETLRVLSGGPSSATFSLWRARVDTGLMYWTVALVVVAVVYSALHRWRRWRGMHRAPAGLGGEELSVGRGRGWRLFGHNPARGH